MLNFIINLFKKNSNVISLKKKATVPLTPDQKVQKENRLKLADYLETQVPDSHYNHAFYHDEIDPSIGCAVGHAANMGLIRKDKSYWEESERVFGEYVYDRIFATWNTFNRLDVIEALRNYKD